MNTRKNIAIFGVVGISILTLSGCGSAATNGSSSTNTVNTPTNVTTSTVLWNSTVVKAMEFAGKRTKIPLVAPSWLPTAETVPQDTASSNSLDAQVDAKATRDDVTLWNGNKPLPINDQSMPFGLYALIGGFGSEVFSTDAQAKTVASNPNQSVDFGYLGTSADPALAKPLSPIKLGHGVTALISKPYNPWGAREQLQGITWKQGDWTFLINPSDPNGNVIEAKAVVTFLANHKLPSGHGLLVINNVGDGDHSFARWAVGHTVYSSWTWDNPTLALRMAESMQPYQNKG